jgi:hypothetical protein
MEMDKHKARTYKITVIDTEDEDFRTFLNINFELISLEFPISCYPQIILKPRNSENNGQNN